MLNKIKKNKNITHFMKNVRKRMVDAEIINSATVVAYYLLLSLFPLLIALGNILPFLRINSDAVMPYIAQLMPRAIFEDLRPAIQSLLTQRSGGLLSLSALTTLWSASRSIHALQLALNKAYGVPNRQNPIFGRLISLIIIILLFMALIGVVFVLGLGQVILEFLQPLFHFSNDFIYTFQTLKMPITFIVLLVSMLLLYWLVPNAKLKSRSIFPGALFSTVGWLLSSQIFSLYAKYFRSAVVGYQIIGSLIVLMLWLNLAAIIIILGGIINAIVEDYATGGHIQNREPIFNKVSGKIRKISKSRHK